MITSTWTPQTGPIWSIDLRFEAVDGRVECTGLTLSAADPDSPGAVNRSVLRSIPVGALLQEAREDHGLDLLGLLQPFKPTVKAARLGDLQAHDLGLGAKGSKVGRPPLSTEQLREVAKIYLSAPSKPTKAVQDHFDFDYEKAARWVRIARQRGLIAPTSKGKPSGAGLEQA